MPLMRDSSLPSPLPHTSQRRHIYQSSRPHIRPTPTPTPSRLAGKSHQDPKASQDTRNGSIGNDNLPRGPGHAQTQPAVDDPERNHEPPVPEMEVGPNLPSAEFLEAGMVDEAEDGLEEEGCQDDETDDGMVVNARDVQLFNPSAGNLVDVDVRKCATNQTPSSHGYLHLPHQPDPQCRCGDEEDIGYQLRDGVKPQGQPARNDSHGHCSDREQDDECHGREDAVDGPVVGRLFDVEAHCTEGSPAGVAPTPGSIRRTVARRRTAVLGLDGRGCRHSSSTGVHLHRGAWEGELLLTQA